MKSQASDTISQQLEEHFVSQLALCDALEKIADDIPHQLDKQTCLCVARSIKPIIKSAHDFEEQVLFPHLSNSDKLGPSADKVLERLHDEHWEDESYGEEIAEALRQFVQGENKNAEMLGYMLRGFFEGVKRHIAFEKEHLKPLI